MDITTLAAWGEFLGGIAVIVSLIYLASQIRQNSKLMRSSTASATATSNTAVNTLIVQDPEVARIYSAGMADRSSMPEEDQLRFDALIGMLMNLHNQEHQFAQDEVIAPAVWVTRQRAVRTLFRLAGMKHWWNEWRDIYGDAFRDYVDGLIREGEAAG